MKPSIPHSRESELTEEAIYGIYGEVAERVRVAKHEGLEPNVDDLIADNPNLADAIRNLLPALAAMHQMNDGCEYVGPVPLTEPDTDRPHSELGDFRIICEIGRGGMGVVYEAEQISLGRHVALKVLPFAAVLDDRQLQRFKNEALAAGQLDHPHIVDVYGVGCIRGVHYYAMRYVEGQTLAEMILNRTRTEATWQSSRESDANPEQAAARCIPEDETRPRAEFSTQRSVRDPVYFRSVANMAIQLADALDYAHTQGVVHRDVKPSNVIVDRQGKPWLTDFGLAHIEANASLTISGDLVGTLRYMSPEQARGKHGIVDHRCDIYSLGATLYELLTLHPAIDGIDRPELIRQVTSDKVRALREHNPSIPIELETIVLKAMAKLPEERYATARELEDDLRRYCDGKAILARRPSWLDHTGKWFLRHRTAVVFGIVLLVVTSILSSWSVTWLSQQLKRSNENQRRAVHAELEQRKANKKLAWRLSLYEASQRRLSRRPGQRLDAIGAIREAAALHADFSLAHDELLQVRNEAVAAFALPDVREVWRKRTANQVPWGFTMDSGRTMYTGRDDLGDLVIRNVNDDRVVCRIPGLTNVAVTPCFSEDGCLLGLIGNDSALVWDVHAQQKLREWSGTIGWIDFSPDNLRIAVALDNGKICVAPLDPQSSAVEVAIQVIPMNSMKQNVKRFCFDPRGERLAVSFESRLLEIYRIADQTLLRSQELPDDLHGIAWDPRGQILACACEDRNSYCIDVGTGLVISVQQGHPSAVRILNGKFLHHGDFLLSGSYRSCWLWDPQSGDCLMQLDELRRHPVAGDSQAGFFDYATNEEKVLEIVPRWELRTIPGGGWCVDFSADGRLIAVADEEGGWIFDAATCRKLSNLGLGICHTVFFTPDGDSLVTDSRQYGLLRWPLQRNADEAITGIGPPFRLAADLPNDPARMPYVSVNGNWMAWRTDDRRGRILRFDDPGQSIEVDNQQGISFICASPDGRWAATWDDRQPRSIDILDLATWQVVKRLPGAAPFQFSPDGKWFITTGPNVVVYETDSWQTAQRFPSLVDSTSTFSPDSRILAVPHLGSRGTVIKLIDVSTWQELAQLEAPHPARCSWVSFSADGTKLAVVVGGAPPAGSRSTGGHTQIWNLSLIREGLRELNLDWEPTMTPNTHAPTQPLTRDFQLDRGFLDDLDEARAEAKQGRWSAAAAAYAKALERQPDDQDLIREHERAQRQIGTQRDSE